MARLPDVPDGAIPAELSDLAEAQRKRYGTVLNTLRQMAYAPPIALGATAMGRSFSRSKQVPPLISTLLNLRVASIVGCPL
jgi:hypothetical protein